MADMFRAEIFETNTTARMQSGTADPSAGGGVAAPEGTIYLRFVAAAGELWLKQGAAATDWHRVATLNAAQTFTAAQNVATSVIGVGLSGAQAIDATLSNTFRGTFTGAGSLSNPTGLVDGATFVFHLIQGVGGSHAITFGANYDFGDDGAPDTSADAAGTLTIVTGVSDGTKVFCGFKKGFTA